MGKFPSEPAFVLHGEASVSAVVKLEIEGEAGIAVGGVNGRVEVYDAETFKHNGTAYAHPSPAVISSLVFSGNVLLVHARDHAVLMLRRCEDGWKVAREIPTKHPGFCGSCVLGASLFLPVVEKTTHSVEVVPLEEGENSRKRFNFGDCEATPTCSTADGERVYVGSDHGSIMILSQEKKVLEVSLGPSPIFALAVSEKHVAAGSSAEAPIFLLDKEDLQKKAEEIVYNSKAAGVSSLSFSPSGSTLFGGFWDGVVRGFSVKSKRIVVFLDFHSQTINTLRWIDENRLAVASKDGRISFWTV